MNKVIFLLVLIGMASATKVDAFQGLWSAWKTQHNKFYHASEELSRFGIFVENFEKVQRLNAEHDSARFALNKFSDLTGTEFAAQYASGAFSEPHKKFLDADTASSSVEDLPDSVDWREKGAVTPVKDQGNCGSCWAFSTTGVLEGFYFINNGTLLSFSEQQLVDCNTGANHGCNGGLPYRAVDYVAQKGIETDSDYPYIARRRLVCRYDESKTIKVAGGYQLVTPKSADQLKAALVNSPVSVLVEADDDAFRFYESGVVTKDCNADYNHAVLAVGYQKIDGVEAFIVKNSWGTSWGSAGYIFIGTDDTINNGKGVCGILIQPLVATN